MRTKEVLVIGAGIAGCAAALALAQRGISVTILTSPFDQRAYHSSFIRHDSLEEKLKNLQREKLEQLNCSRAYEQLMTLASESVSELLEPNYLVDRNGNIDLHRCLQEQLQQHSLVEWLPQHSLIELLTLDNHSQKKMDRYKKIACVGAMTYNHETEKVEHFLAKETILATGGAAALFPFSIHPPNVCGGEVAMAHQIGARLLNMDHVQFHPLGLYEKGKPSIPLPIELLEQGGKIYLSRSIPVEIDYTSTSELLHELYHQLLKTNSEHFWLDLTSLDPQTLKKQFPNVEGYCLAYGLNPTTEFLPVVPVAVYTCGGIAIDKVAQTSIQRLRALGETACSGLFWKTRDEALSVLESLTWAFACAEDIAKQINKLVYYFPELREGVTHLSPVSSILQEDWKMLRSIMWSYVGIYHDRPRLERACALLDKLSTLNAPRDLSSSSIEQIQLYYAIQTARLITHSIYAQQGSLFHRSPQSLINPLG